MANKFDLSKNVSKKLNISINRSKKIVDCVFKSLIDIINDDGSLNVHGFGKFYTVDKQPREARNPKTGEIVQVPAKTVLKFKSSKKTEKIN